MMRASPTPPESIDPYIGGYIAGLIDGEGCFCIRTHIRGTGRPVFTLELRDDDLPLLEWLVATTNIGTIYRRSRPGRGIRPQAEWCVFNNTDLAGLVRLLTRYPLRGKKRQDFAIWQQAVSVAMHTTHAASIQNERIRWRLRMLKHELQAGRAYNGDGGTPPNCERIDEPHLF